jgi:hypothetical protein
MGCPRAFSLSGGMGAALLSKPELISSDVSLIVYRCFGCDRILDLGLSPTSVLNMKLEWNADMGSLFVHREIIGRVGGREGSNTFTFVLFCSWVPNFATCLNPSSLKIRS